MDNRFEYSLLVRFCGVSALCVVLCFTPTASIAQDSTSSNRLYLLPSQIPFLLQNQFRAMGNRLQKPGNERITMNGVLISSSGSSSVKVTVELGGKARIDMSSRSLLFDGKDASNVLGQFDQDLLESLVDDLQETFLGAVALGSGFRLLGQRFADKKGGFGDIYDAFIPGRTNKTHQLKRYGFNSKTGLLSWVQYRSGKEANSALIETRFSDWVVVNGQALPAAVSRTQGGQSVFALEAQEVDLSAAAADGVFGN